MDWTLVAQLIINVGIPAAERIIANWENKAPVTLAEFQEIRKAAQQTAKDRMAAQITAAGIALDDPTALALLSLATGDTPPPAPPPTAPAIASSQL